MVRFVRPAMIACLISLLAASQSPAQNGAQNELSDKVTATLDQAVDAYRSGRLAEVTRLLGPVLQSITPDEMRAADERLKTEHNLEMPLLAMAIEARIEQVLAGQGGQLARPKKIEIAPLLAALDDRIVALLEPVRRELDIGLPALLPDEVLTERVQALVAFETPLDQAAALVTSMHQVSSRLSRADREQLDERSVELAARKLGDEQKKLDAIRDRLTARLVEFCLVRLSNAVATSAAESAPFTKRFEAAVRADESLALIHQQWPRYKAWKKKNGGLEPEVETRWRTLEKQFHVRNADLQEKVTMFREGTQWWLVGRYGRGPLAEGLARPGRVAGVSERVAQASLKYPLIMPPMIRKPQDPLTVPIPFPPARRHHEWWRYLVEPSQLVGYMEYAQALGQFDRLLRVSSLAERRVLDDMIANDDRFVVHSTISSRFDTIDPGSSLRLASRPMHPQATSASERRGLAWVMAHARMELEAMQSVDLSGSVAPFGSVPTPFEQEAFLELLLDSVRMHYYEIFLEDRVRADGIAGRMGPRGLFTLWQIDRKLHLTLALAESFRVRAGTRLTATQHNELQAKLSDLITLGERMRTILAQQYEDGRPGLGRSSSLRAPALPTRFGGPANLPPAAEKNKPD